jgi:hypothetical protein
MRRTPLFAAVALLALAGCGEVDPDAKVAAVSPSVAPSPSTPAILALGQVHTTSDKQARVTVHAYKQPAAKNAPAPQQDDAEWGSLDVEVCIDSLNPDGLGSSVSQGPWALFLANNGIIKSPGISYSSFPIPGYPMDSREVPPGQCVRGWIVFPVPIGQKPARAEYAPSGVTPVSWRLS